MKKNFETLEVGRRYKNRLGKVVKIIDKYLGSTYSFDGDDGESYTPEGQYRSLESHELDLIELLPEQSDDCMQKNFKTLEVGRSYENELGDFNNIVKNDGHKTSPFKDQYGRSYRPEGQLYSKGSSKYDLVRLLPKEPTTRLAELEAKRAELNKEIEELKNSVQTLYCAVYTCGMSKDKLAVYAYESDKKKQEVIDTWDPSVTPIITTFDLPFRKVNSKWEAAFEIVPK